MNATITNFRGMKYDKLSTENGFAHYDSAAWIFPIDGLAD